MTLQKITPTLPPLVFCLAIALAAETAIAQQPAVNTLQQQVEAAAAAEGNSPEALAARDRLRTEMEQARVESGAAAQAPQTQAKPEAATAPAAQTKTTITTSTTTPTPSRTTGNHMSSASGSGTASGPISGVTATASPASRTPHATAAAPNVQRIPIPPASGVGVNAPFAHDYFARFEGRMRTTPPPILEGIGLRGTVQSATLQQQIDADLARERPHPDLQDAEQRTIDAARKQLRMRQPFNQLAQHVPANEKPRRTPKPPFEELN